MLFKICFLTCLIVSDTVNCAMRKSWKSAVNFDTEIPKFTPFDTEDSLTIHKETVHNEIVIKTTPTSTSPSPSAETLISRISSKIKAPSNQIAEIYNQFYQDMHKKPSGDFGTFEDNKEADMPTTEATVEESTQKIQDEPENEPINIQQILNELSEEADKESAASDSPDNDDSVDELEISSVSNDSKNTTQFKVGQLMNVTIDSDDSMVNVNLNQNTLKEIFTGSSS